MTSPFEALLASITRQRGVLGCMIVGEGDGIIVDASVQVGVEAAVVAALAAAMYRRTRIASEAAGLGEVAFLHLDGERGSVCAVGRDGLVLIAITEPRAPIGAVRSVMLQSVEALA